MSKKKKKFQKQSTPSTPEKVIKEEGILDFEEAKDMTIEQVVRKQRDLKDGIKEEDNILDRYIKQHRDDIEAEKFETLVAAPAITDQDLTETKVMDSLEARGMEDAEPYSDLQIHKVEAAPKKEEEFVKPLPPVMDIEDDFFDDQEEAKKSKKKKIIIWSVLATVFAGVLATAYFGMNQSNSGQTKTSSSTSSSKVSSSSSKDANVTAFDKLYESFFTDKSQTKLKNSEFGKLDQLKAALDKIGTANPGYKTAKAKYDVLEKAIQSIKDINGKFDKPAIVNGELDTTAKVKSDASFESVSTGLSAVDTLLTSAINMGRTQKPADSQAASNQVQGQAQEASSAGATPVAPSASEVVIASEAPATSAASNNSTNPGWVSINGIIYGKEIPAGMSMQRELSRVPYNQAAIDDVTNESWIFNPGILENIINISRQRGYITGDDYYLEKVNIINGNGYYNLFKPDGTYLFSMNCKTGYFVGNAPGRADALDY